MTNENSDDINGTHDGKHIQEYSKLGMLNIKVFTNMIKKTFYFCIDSSVQELIQAAIEVRKNAYCPYSDFAVGSAVRTKSNEIITGCNVENGAYGPSICAERNAFCHAVALGHREFIGVAVVAYQEKSFTTPCGYVFENEFKLI